MSEADRGQSSTHGSKANEVPPQEPVKSPALQPQQTPTTIRPLRAIHQTIRLVRRGFKLVQQRGGISAIFREVYRVLREEGFTSLKLRLDHWNANSTESAGEIYREWVKLFDTIDDEKRSRAKASLAQWPYHPLISIVVPTYKAPERYLREMIESVQAQLYPYWELCIADDASPDPAIERIIAEYTKLDQRIKFVRRVNNGHISAASNSALELATGAYVALLDQDDVIPEHALYVVAKYINSHPHGRLFYSDEDKLIAGSGRSTPYFKSDWNPELILAQNFFSHLGVFETRLIREIGGFREGFEGSQDHDLVLRCVAAAGHDAVVHIPHVLYHWRVIPGSTSAGISQKPYVLRASIAAVESFLEGNKISATVSQAFAGSNMMRVSYALPNPLPRATIVIVAHGPIQALKSGIDSVLRKTAYTNYEILLIVDESLNPDMLRMLEEMEQDRTIRIIRSTGSLAFAALNNCAVEQAQGDYICLLKAGLSVTAPGYWLDEMMGYAARPQNGAVGASLFYKDNRLYQGALLLGIDGLASTMHHKIPRGFPGYFGRAALPQNISAISSDCLLIRKSTYLQVHGLDETLSDIEMAVDFCLKVEDAGYRNVYTPHAQLYIDIPSRSESTERPPYKLDDEAIVRRRWEDRIARDPFYNPNLAVQSSSLFSPAFPPRTTPFA